jgi:peptide subunit release factor 1 (eRF1)
VHQRRLGDRLGGVGRLLGQKRQLLVAARDGGVAAWRAVQVETVVEVGRVRVLCMKVDVERLDRFGRRCIELEVIR